MNMTGKHTVRKMFWSPSERRFECQNCDWRTFTFSANASPSKYLQEKINQHGKLESWQTY